MNTKSKLFVIIVASGLSLLLISLYIFKEAPIIFRVSDSISLETEHNVLLGDTIAPFEHFIDETGSWSAYIVVARSDREDKSKVYYSSDQELLRNMFRDYSFVYAGEDIATAESEFFLYCEGELKFSSGLIWTEELCGLQSRSFGWGAWPKLNEYLLKFDTYYWPFIIL